MLLFPLPIVVIRSSNENVEQPTTKKEHFQYAFPVLDAAFYPPEKYILGKPIPGAPLSCNLASACHHQ